MMKCLLFLGALAVSATTFAQSGVANVPTTGDDPVLMTVDGKPVARSEFEAIYKKNNKDAAVTKKALDEYLELFVNYKLKVRAAEALGMDTIGKFKTELDGYRKQLARPYLIDRELNDNLMHEAYDRSTQEIRASHILVKLNEEPTPEDTLAAWKKVNLLRDRVMKGEDWASVAKSGSDDPSAAKNGGDLGWFSALSMVYPFETGAYNTPVGQISKPVRTRFGYHIIKVVDKRPARGQVKVGHIMVRSTEEDSPEKKASAEKKINEVAGRLKSGELNFGDAALKYSDDESTNTKGGELPMFGTGKMIDEFEDAAFALTSDNEVSAPVKTRYGWHIIKRLEYKAPPTFDEAKADLKSRIARDSRAEITRKKFLEDLKASYHFKQDDKAIKAILPLVDSTIFKKGTAITDTLIRSNVVEGPIMYEGMKFNREISGTMHGGKMVSIHRKSEEVKDNPTDTVVVRDTQAGWAYDRTKAAKFTKPVFSVDGKSYSQTDLLNYLESHQKREPKLAMDKYVSAKFKTYVDDELLAFEDGQLEKKYPEFRMLMKEYRDGILLFELTDQKVWSKAVKDSAGLQSYYDGHKMEYLYPVRYDADIYTCADANTSKQTRALYKKGKRGEDLTTAMNKTNPAALFIESGRWTIEEKPILKDLNQPGLTVDTEKDGKVVFADMKQVVPPSPKPLSESRGLVTAAYQDQLEKDWIKELRAKYEVKVQQDVLYSIH